MNISSCATEGVRERGGVGFLECCSHLVGVRGSRWEGRGRESRFIRCLIAAFERTSRETP